jgi:hypothetical protein
MLDDRDDSLADPPALRQGGGRVSRERYCTICRQAEHHRPDCPEMSFPSGRRRDDPGPSTPLRPCNPGRQFPLRQESPLSEEMAHIFAGAAERNLRAHMAEMERQRAIEAEVAP